MSDTSSSSLNVLNKDDDDNDPSADVDEEDDVICESDWERSATTGPLPQLTK